MGKLTIFTAVFFLLFTPASLAQSSTCLSAYPDACASGVYDPDVVTNFMENAFSNQSNTYIGINPDPGDDGFPDATCVLGCSARFHNWISNCEQIPEDPNGVAGTSARNSCILLGETRYLECMGDCQFSSTP